MDFITITVTSKSFGYSINVITLMSLMFLLTISGSGYGVLTATAVSSTANDTLVPAIFYLGDSVLDPGNNNDLVTLAKVNYYPYGIDFPGGVATGRFSNGYTAADYIALQLGFPLIPAYNHPGTKGKKLLNGVNFASGGSGIQSTTGKLYGAVVSLDEQIENLWKVKKEIIEMIGGDATEKLFAEAAFAVITGSNDWLLAYFNPIIPDIHSPLLSPEDYSDRIIQKLISHVKSIYETGARNIVVASVPPLGCCPSLLHEYNSNGSCVTHINDILKSYNDKLLPKVLALNKELSGANIMYINIFTPILNAAENPNDYGFKNGNVACCGIGKYKGFITCLRGFVPCDNVEDHLYWDAYHPTAKYYPQLVSILWNNGPPYSYPVSLKEAFSSKTQQEEKDIHTEL